MKKVLIANALKKLHTDIDAFLDRTDIKVFTAGDNDEVLKIHRAEKVDLIITKIDMPGIRSEELYSIIRQNKELQKVSTIIICDQTPTHRARCAQCGANGIITIPIDVTKLHSKMLELLDVAPRRPYRVALNVSVEGKFNNKPFLFRTEDISTTGMLIKAKSALAQSDRISFSFYLPSGVRISARGVIERVVKLTSEPEMCLYGIKFTDIEANDKLTIETFVNKRIAKQDPA